MVVGGLVQHVALIKSVVLNYLQTVHTMHLINIFKSVSDKVSECMVFDGQDIDH